MRHPSFEGLREDKSAEEVVLERPLAIDEVNGARTTAKKGRKQSASTKPTAASKRAQSNGSSAAPDVELPQGVRLTHPDKILYPDVGITKAQLAGYYVQIAEWILPQLVDRPLVLVRCPDGQSGECFYQKHARTGTPETLRRVPVVEKSKTVDYVAVDDLEDLLSLVQIGVLEIHVWGSRIDKIELPDRLVFDLDPDPSVPWPRVIESAQQMRSFFKDLGLTAFLKTSGGKGLHLVLPVQRKLDWDDTRDACQQIAEAIVRADPSRYTANMSKAARSNKIYVDYLRNARGATAVAAYSTRARAGAPVSMPISWEELPTLRSPDQFSLLDVPARLAKLKKDPWKDLPHTRQTLSKSLLKKLED